MPSTSTRQYVLSPWHLMWLSFGLIANIPVGYGAPSNAQIAVGALGLLHCVVYFIKDGNYRITAPGVYLVASGVFAFFPAISMVLDGQYYPPASTLAAVNVAYWVQFILFHYFWEPGRSSSVTPQFIEDNSVTTWGSALGLVLIMFGMAIGALMASEVAIQSGSVVFVGIVLLSVSVFLRGARLAAGHYLLVAVAVLVYVEFVFTGFGRLAIGALGIAVIVALAPRWRGLPKVALLLAFPGLLSYLAADRVQFTAEINPNQSPTTTGLESVIGPFVRFSQTLLLEAEGDLPRTWLSSFYAALVSLVPRELWPDKPVGFGAEVAMFFRPELAGFGHSEVVLFYGEWVWAFGFFGLLVMIPVIGLFVRWVDSQFAGITARPLTRRHILVITLFTLLIASIPDLFWGGAFTYVARVGPRLLLVGALFLVAWSSVKRDRARDGLLPEPELFGSLLPGEDREPTQRRLLEQLSGSPARPLARTSRLKPNARAEPI